MQSTLVDATSYLQLYSTELLGYCIIVQADSKLTGRSAAPTTGLLTLFLLVEHGKLSIANACDKDLLFVIYHKTYQYRITTSFIAVCTHQFNALFCILKQC